MRSPFLAPTVGMALGLGVLLLLSALAQDGPSIPRPVQRRRRVQALIDGAGIRRITPSTLLVTAVGLGFVGALLGLVLTGVPVVGLLSGLVGLGIPVVMLRRAARRRAVAVQRAWPDAVDTLVSGVRAGLSLGEALASLAERGPQVLRPSFEELAGDLRATGALDPSLEALRVRMGDPVADRVVAALRIAREVGGCDLGRVLRDLAAMLRADARIRGEISARQSWTVSSARVAIAAPWLTLVLLCTRPEAAQAYRSSAGLAVILSCAACSVLAYRLMTRLARLPSDTRIA